MFNVTLTITPEQFIVINEFLAHSRLGNDNIYREAITNLALDLEKAGAEAEVKSWLEHMGIGKPYFTVEYNEDEGMSFNVFEKE